MRIDVEMSLPFSFCKLCNAIQPEKYTFGESWKIIKCEHEGLCMMVEDARKAEEANDDR